jgi:ubiquinone biosynthesis protein COQ4
MAKHIRSRNLEKLVGSISAPSKCRTQPDARCFSVLNRPKPNYEGHIPLTITERLGLAFGSGLGSFVDPRRGGELPAAMKSKPAC